MKSWKAVSCKHEEPAFNELTAWQKAMDRRDMQVIWEPGLTWNDVLEPNQEDEAWQETASSSNTFSPADQALSNELEVCKLAHEKSGNQLQSSSLDILSCFLNGGGGGVLTRVEWKDDKNMVLFGNNPSQIECEIQHIRNKRLRFLQQNKTEEGFTSDLKQEDGEREQSQTIVLELPDSNHGSSSNQPVSNQNLHSSLSECFGSSGERCQQCKLLWDVHLTQGDVLEVTEINAQCSSHDQLPIVVQEVDKSCNLQHICPPSPDRDQGYHSLEYWQCSSLQQNLTTANIETPESCELDRESVLFALQPGLPACPSLVKDKNDQNGKGMDSDLQDSISISSVTICTNKHIGYILGTVVSDNGGTSSSSCDEWDKEEDDGFDSEGLSTTDSDTSATEGVLWNSFCSDAYNLQNFTASLQTSVTRENILSLEAQDEHLSEEESWCDSNAESGSDKESDCSADEEKNIKLWNAFLKFDDPYNPLYFKAPVQTSDKKKQSSEIDGTYSETVCRPLTDHKVACQEHDLHQLQFKETHNVEDSANLGPKKVTFHEEVTIYNVCDEERKGHWEELARDRCRFQRRIQETEFVIGHCLTTDHRQRTWERMQGQWDS